jgi:hypothetical protein
LSFTVVVPKKSGKLRICIDFRKLNAATKKDPYPLPFTNEVMNTISIAPNDKYKTTFVTN